MFNYRQSLPERKRCFNAVAFSSFLYGNRSLKFLSTVRPQSEDGLIRRVSNSKSLKLPRRNSRRASRRGGVVRHQRRQGLLPSDAPPRATACENVAACD